MSSTRITIQAALEETNKDLKGGHLADNRDKAIQRLIDDIAYSRQVEGRDPNPTFEVQLVGTTRVTNASGKYQFHTLSITIPDALFPISAGGLQHLVGILSDALPTKTGSIHWKNAKVTSLELSEKLREDAENRFRVAAHKIADIRTAFKLRANRPLLAFSFKPRVGIELAEVKDVAGDLAAAGFNIVEFDTRRLEDAGLGATPSLLDKWVEIQEEMTARANGRPVAFSPNLSIRSDIAVEIATEWCRRVSSSAPTTIKVDGGLDGLSTIQAIREEIQHDPPIITCYPLLRRSLATSLGSGPDDLIDLLAISGVDIIYPGNRPAFTDDFGRLVSGEDLENSVNGAQRRYMKYLDQGWPMPSFAAGAHAGDLHVAQNLLGGDTAMFLGDALTCSKLGIRKAGELIAALVDATADEMMSDDPTLPKKLLAEYGKHFDKNTFIGYEKIFGPGKAIPLRQVKR